MVEGARAFAAAIVGATDERSESLVARGAHPDVVEFEPTTATYTLANEIRAPRAGETARRDSALPRVIPEIHKAPIEGDRKVVMVRDADRMEEVVGNTLLKSIEEPPPRTRDPAAHRPARRDARDDPVAVPAGRLRVRAAGALRGDRRGARARSPSVVPRVDGRAATTVELVEGLEAALDAAGATSEAAAAAELEELDADIEARGYPPRTAAALRRRLGERQRQELRRAKTDALIEGISAIEQAYLDVLADAPGAVGGRPGPGVRRARRLPRRPAGRRVQPERRLAAAAPGVAAPARRLSRKRSGRRRALRYTAGPRRDSSVGRAAHS